MRTVLSSTLATGQLVALVLVLFGPRRAEMYLRLCGRSVDAARDEGHHAQTPRVAQAFVPFRWTVPRPRTVCLSGPWSLQPGRSRKKERNAVAWLCVGPDWRLSNPIQRSMRSS